ncbi:hypothetical protein L6Q96_07095 [Candidatus Binatia bacterium]|nr:hypothetical protein [Candidatus Binatia bacterium]
MTAYDLVFLAVAVAVSIGPGPGRWVAVLAPAIAWAGAIGPWPAGLGFPLAAGLIVLAAPRVAPVALVLAVPEYEGVGEVLRAMALWVAATALVDAIVERLQFGDEVAVRLQGVPMGLAACAIVYFALQPLAYVFR